MRPIPAFVYVCFSTIFIWLYWACRPVHNKNVLYLFLICLHFFLTSSLSPMTCSASCHGTFPSSLISLSNHCYCPPLVCCLDHQQSCRTVLSFPPIPRNYEINTPDLYLNRHLSFCHCFISGADLLLYFSCVAPPKSRSHPTS